MFEISIDRKPKDYNKIDVFIKKGIVDKVPVVIWIHGGAFVGGDKKDVRTYASAICANGYNVVSMNYEMAQRLQIYH